MNPMEEIWQSTSIPGKDGQNYIVFQGIGDLSFLYLSGFVDVDKFSFQEWADSFRSSRQKDGSYRITHEQWLEKKKFRYSGPIGVPFDPMSLEEREYPEAEFLKILSEKVLPNTIFDRKSAPKLMENLRLFKKLHGGKVTLDKEVKQALTQILTDYASPRRFMEMTVENLRKQKDAKAALSEIESQRSKFAAGKTAQEIAAARLSEIAKEIKKEATTAAGPSVSLKELKKKKREIKA
jgi:predicted DNA binding CopG/RHH family protein